MSKALPLDGPDWLPLADAHRLLCSLTGNRRLAARDLTDALASGDVQAMQRCIARVPGADRELVQRPFWDWHEVDSWSDALLVRRRGHRQVVVVTRTLWRERRGARHDHRDPLPAAPRLDPDRAGTRW